MPLPGFPITITANGPSQSFNLPIGDHWLFLRSSSWGSMAAALQISPDDSSGSYANAETESGNAISVNKNWQQPIAGGAMFRFNVTNYSSPIVVTAERSSALP